MAWKKKQRGLVGTVVFHGGLILIFVLLGLTAPFPPPDEEGILVNFGTNDMGGGFVEPQRQQYTPPVVEKERVSPPVVNDPVEDIPDDSKEEAENLLTQDIEDAAAVNAQRNEEEEKLRKQREEEEKLKEEERERQRQAELERQRIEEERIRQEEAERQRLEEERRKQAEQDAQRKAISDRMNKSFGGAADSGSTGSEGVTGGEGNQGMETGSVNSQDHTMINSTGNNGISYSLAGRNVVGNLKKPDYPGQESGKVVVQITVNKDGRVVSAVPGVRGSTTTNSRLYEAARKAALTARFNKVTDPNAPITQKGTITYDFRLTGG